jgi:hypothetical protein
MNRGEHSGRPEHGSSRGGPPWARGGEDNEKRGSSSRERGTSDRPDMARGKGRPEQAKPESSNGRDKDGPPSFGSRRPSRDGDGGR